MKAFSICLTALILSTSSYALESGNYINKSYTSNDPGMYQSMSLDTSKCEKGGAIIKFKNADVMNFCIGFNKDTVNVYKKCIGKELPYPFGKCIGVQVNVTYTQKYIVERDEEGNIVQTDISLVDDKITFEQTRTLIEENGKLTVVQQFLDHKDGRNGIEEYTFSKQ